MEGRIVSHYRIIEQLGGGGMGVVYQDFLASWRGADADVPILQAARREYERMKP